MTYNPNDISIYNQSCFDGLKNTLDNCIDFVVTDPPYFIDGLDDEWDVDEVNDRVSKAGVIGSLPVGMKFDKEQGIEFQKFFTKVSREIYRVLKPGGFFVSFSQGRLYHRMAVAAEDEGFEIRDMLGWVYSGQAKAFSQDHFVRKMDIPEDKKEEIIRELDGRKTPQLKPMIEPMILAQKPKEGTLIDNWLKYKTGLMDTTESLDGGFPGNIMAAPKPLKKEYNIHITVKPLKLIEHLIKLFTVKDAIVLDPFMGSGTTAIACMNTGRKCIGYEINKKYYDVIIERLG